MDMYNGGVYAGAERHGDEASGEWAGALRRGGVASASASLSDSESESETDASWVSSPSRGSPEHAQGGSPKANSSMEDSDWDVVDSPMLTV